MRSTFLTFKALLDHKKFNPTLSVCNLFTPLFNLSLIGSDNLQSHI